MTQTLDTDSPQTLVVDIGGTGLKMMVLDARGAAISARARVLTPRPALLAPVLACCEALAAQQPAFDRVSVGFPGVVRDGVVLTAPNLDTFAWAGHDLARSLGKRLQRPVRVVNDADLQGQGVVCGQGVELVLTLGTGMGAALFVSGRLVPNLELGQHRHRRGRSYEDLVGHAARKKVGKKRWRRRVQVMLNSVQNLFSADHIYIGGGEAKHLHVEDLPYSVSIFAAEAGLSGGARLWDDAGPERSDGSG